MKNVKLDNDPSIKRSTLKYSNNMPIFLLKFEYTWVTVLGSLWASFKRKLKSRTYLTSPWRPHNKLKIKICNFSWKVIWCRCLSQFSFQDLWKHVSCGKKALSSPTPRSLKMPNQNEVNSRKSGKNDEIASPSQTIFSLKNNLNLN